MSELATYLCLSRDLERGRYLRLSRGGDDFVVYRSAGGHPVAALNRCHHRGFPVASAASGELPLRCPYHGLPFTACERRPVCEFQSALFLYSDGNDLDMDEEMAGRMDFCLGEEFGRNEMIVRAPYQLWLQNTADPNHLRHVHRVLPSVFAEPMEPYDVRIYGVSSSYKMRVHPEVHQRHTDLIGRQLHDYFYHFLLAPNLSVTSFLGVFHSVETANPHRDGCSVLTRFFVDRSMELPGTMKRLALQRNIAVLEEDREIVERWALGRPWAQPKAWLPGEERVRHYVERMRLL